MYTQSNWSHCSSCGGLHYVAVPRGVPLTIIVTTFFFISKHVTYAGMLELCKLEGRPAVCYYFLILAMASPGLVNVAIVYMQCADMHALIPPP